MQKNPQLYDFSLRIVLKAQCVKESLTIEILHEPSLSDEIISSDSGSIIGKTFNHFDFTMPLQYAKRRYLLLLRQ